MGEDDSLTIKLVAISTSWSTLGAKLEVSIAEIRAGAEQKQWSQEEAQEPEYLDNLQSHGTSLSCSSFPC